FLYPKTYTAESQILPPQQNSSSALMASLGQLSGLANMISGAGMSLKTPSDLYMDLLESRSVQDALIDKFDLRHVYGKKTMEEARKKLTRNTTFTAHKSSLITIEVDDHDAQRARDIANGYTEILYKLTQDLAITEAGQRRMFFERQLSQE